MATDHTTGPPTGPPTSRLSLRVGARTDVGLVRDENQDRISRFRTPLGEVFLVVDGMGGHRGGSQAAEMTVAGLERALTSARPETPPAEALRDAAAAAHAEIRHRAESPEADNPEMGATAVMVLLREGQAIVAHAGDSRAYLLRGDRLTRLTSDHTVVQRMVDQGLLSVEDARDHPDASVVSRAFGRNTDFELEVAPPLDLRVDDRLLLCSDGLCGYVEDGEIGEALRGAGAQAVADRLTELALAGGGEDNVSVQVLSFRDPEAVAAAAPAGAVPRTGKAAPAGRWGALDYLYVLLAAVLGILIAHFFLIPVARSWLGGDEPASISESAASRSRNTNDVKEPVTDPRPPRDKPDPEATNEEVGEPSDDDGGEDPAPTGDAVDHSGARFWFDGNRIAFSFRRLEAAGEPREPAADPVEFEKGSVYHAGPDDHAQRVAGSLGLGTRRMPSGSSMHGERLMVVVLPPAGAGEEPDWSRARVYFARGLERKARELADKIGAERSAQPFERLQSLTGDRSPILVVAVDENPEEPTP